MRDQNIQKNYKREINLQTRVVRDRTKYTRKQKHKNKESYVSTLWCVDIRSLNICKCIKD